MRKLTHKSNLQEILVLEPELDANQPLVGAIARMVPHACVRGESDPAAAARALSERPVKMLVVAVNGFDLDIVALLGVWADHSADSTRVLVVASDVNSTAVAALRTMPISGVFDRAHDTEEELGIACRAVLRGANYWSSTIYTLISTSVDGEYWPHPADAASVDLTLRRPPGCTGNRVFGRRKTRRARS